MDKARHRNDRLFLIGALVLCALLFFVQRILLFAGTKGDERQVVVTLDGETALRCPLSAMRDARTEEELRAASEIYDEDILSFSEEGVEVRTSLGYNIISYAEEGEGGLICTAADCPDKVCMDTGVVRTAAEAIVCLPHRLTARVQ